MQGDEITMEDHCCPTDEIRIESNSATPELILDAVVSGPMRITAARN
jgi:hypothetical protein